MTDGQREPSTGIWNFASLLGDDPPPVAPPAPVVAPPELVVAPPELVVALPEPAVAPAASAPPPPAVVPRRAGLKIALVVAVAVGLGGVGIAAATTVGGRGRSPAAAPVTAPVTAAPTLPPTVPPAPPAVVTSAPAPAPVTTTPPGADPETEALAALESIRARDRPAVRFVGQYAAQLASKSVGISDPFQTTSAGAHTFGAADILAEHQALRGLGSQGVTIVLVMSTDFGKLQLYQGLPLWMTFALGDFASVDAVNAWCADRFPALSGDALKNQCLPRRLEPARA